MLDGGKDLKLGVDTGVAAGPIGRLAEGGVNKPAWGAPLPIIVLNVYEHLSFMDDGANRQAYLNASWKNFNWTTANDLFKRACSIRL